MFSSQKRNNYSRKPQSLWHLTWVTIFLLHHQLHVSSKNTFSRTQHLLPMLKLHVNAGFHELFLIQKFPFSKTFNAGGIITDVIIGLIVARIDIYCTVSDIANTCHVWSFMVTKMTSFYEMLGSCCKEKKTYISNLVGITFIRQRMFLLGLTVTSIDSFYDMLSTWGILLSLKWKMENKCVCKCNVNIVKYYTKRTFSYSL